MWRWWVVRGGGRSRLGAGGWGWGAVGPGRDVRSSPTISARRFARPRAASRRAEDRGSGRPARRGRSQDSSNGPSTGSAQSPDQTPSNRSRSACRRRGDPPLPAKRGSAPRTHAYKRRPPSAHPAVHQSYQRCRQRSAHSQCGGSRRWERPMRCVRGPCRRFFAGVAPFGPRTSRCVRPSGVHPSTHYL